MWIWHGYEDAKGTKALNRMWDEMFDCDGEVRNRRCMPRIKKDFIMKINQDPVMRYDWRFWNIGAFDTVAFAHMCDASRVVFEIRRKSDDSVVCIGFDKSSPFRNVPLADFINSLDFVGLYATMDGIKIQNFDYCHHADGKLGAKQ